MKGWRYRPVERMYRDGKPVCSECGDFINPEDYGGKGKKRSDAVFCNDYCRNRYHRVKYRLVRV